MLLFISVISMHTLELLACKICGRPVGLMDKASASGAGDSRFESWAGQIKPCIGGADTCLLRKDNVNRQCAGNGTPRPGIEPGSSA